MREKLKYLNTPRGWLWCAIIVSFFINILFIGKSYMIYLSTDEQGPFAVAALLNGVDWSSTTSNLAYYSYGYAFILAPIFWLTKSARALYQGAIVVNALMATAIVPIAWSVGKRLNRNISDRVMVGIAFCVAHYSCIIVRSHLALYEMTLIFLTWLLTWLYFSMEEKPRFWKYLLFGGLLIYGYAVHQRMLGIVLAGGLAMLVHFLKLMSEKKGPQVIRYFIVAAVAMAAAFVLHRYCKQLFKGSLWLNSAVADVNDFAGMSGRFDKFLTRQGFNSLIKEFFGQMFYMGVATFVIGFVGAFRLIQTNLQTLKALLTGKKQAPEYAMSQLFILLAFFASVGISILFMAGGMQRADYLVYGRYIEMTFGPILLIGLLHLISKEERPALYSLLSVGALVVCTLITDYSYGNVRGGEFAGVSCIGLNIFRYDGYLHVYAALLWAVGVFTVAFLALRKGKETLKLITLILIAAGWTYVGSRLLLDVILPAEKCTYEYTQLLDARDEGTEDWPVYYSGPSGKTYEAPFIQFLMKDKILHYIDGSQLTEVEQDCYVINKHSPVEMQEGFTLLGGSNGTFIYRHDGSKMDNVIELPVTIFKTITGKTDSEGMVNEGEGFLMYGPYLTLIAGTYKIEVKYQILSDEAKGYFDMVGVGTSLAAATHAESRIENNSCDENGIYTAELQFCLVETWESEELRCYVESGQIRVLGAVMTYSRDMVDLPLSLFATELAAEDGQGVVNTDVGRLFYGPDITWYLGDYEIQIEYEALTEELKGSFSLYSGHDLLDETAVSAGGGTAVLHVSVGENPMERVNLCCDIESGQIRITNVTVLRTMEE